MPSPDDIVLIDPPRGLRRESDEYEAWVRGKFWYGPPSPTAEDVARAIRELDSLKKEFGKVALLDNGSISVVTERIVHAYTQHNGNTRNWTLDFGAFTLTLPGAAKAGKSASRYHTYNRTNSTYDFLATMIGTNYSWPSGAITARPVHPVEDVTHDVYAANVYLHDPRYAVCFGGGARAYAHAVLANSPWQMVNALAAVMRTPDLRRSPHIGIWGQLYCRMCKSAYLDGERMEVYDDKVAKARLAAISSRAGRLPRFPIVPAAEGLIHACCGRVIDGLVPTDHADRIGLDGALPPSIIALKGKEVYSVNGNFPANPKAETVGAAVG